jgi:hypothetical protein
MIKSAVLFAARHKCEAGQVREHRPGAVLAKDMEQGAFRQELVRREVARDGGERLAQLLSVPPVAAVAKRAEPLEAVGLTEDGARSYQLATLASRVAGRAHLIQPAKGWRQVVGLRQRALPGRLPRPIDIKDHPAGSGSIHQPSDLLVGGEWATLEISKKEGAQRFNRRFCQRR